MTSSARRVDRNLAIARARLLLASDPVVIDTETTGFGPLAEICEFAAINREGSVLVNTLVRPQRPIPADATGVHGIANADVADSPSFHMVLAEYLPELLVRVDMPLATYNAEYDLRLMDQSSGGGSDWRDRENTHCIMDLYARYHGEWSERHGSHTWQPLDEASAQCGLGWDGQPHRALADARMALGVLEHMAGTERKS